MSWRNAPRLHQRLDSSHSLPIEEPVMVSPPYEEGTAHMGAGLLMEPELLPPPMNGNPARMGAPLLMEPEPLPSPMGGSSALLPPHGHPPAQKELEPELAPVSAPGAESAMPQYTARLGDKARHRHEARHRRAMGLLVGFLVVCAIIVGGALGKAFGDHKGRAIASAKGSNVAESSGGGSGTAGTSGAGNSASVIPSTPTLSPDAAMSGSAVADYTYNYPTPVYMPNWSALQVFCVFKPGSELHVLTQNTTTTATTNQTQDYGWTALGSVASSPISAASAVGISANIFGRGLTGGMYHKYESTFGVWGPSAKGDENLGGYLYSPPAVAWRSANELNTFVIGGSDALFINSWVGGAGWTSYSNLGGSWASFAPTAVSWGAGRLDAFVVGLADGRLYHRWWVPGSTSLHPAATFEDLGGSLAGRPVVVSGGNKRMDVFARGADAGLWHLEYSGDQWNQWTRVDGPAIVAEPDAVALAVNDIHVFVWIEDGSYQRRSFEGGKWNSTEDLGGIFSGPPKAVAAPEGSIHVYGYSKSSDLMHRSWDRTAGVWSPANRFENFGGPDGSGQ